MPTEAKKRRDLTEAKNEADKLIETAEQSVVDAAGKATVEDASALAESVRALRAAIAHDDLADIRQKTAALRKSLTPFNQPPDKRSKPAPKAARTAATGAKKKAEADPPEPPAEEPPAEEPPAEEPPAQEPPAAEPPAPVTPAVGAFTVKTHDTHPEEIEDKIEFNIEPSEDYDGPIPDEQREISYGIYATWGVLKLLREQGVFTDKDKSFVEFRARLLQVGEVGLAASHVRTHLAAKALAQIREEISLRRGIKIKLKYLFRLFCWGLLGVAVGAILVMVSRHGIPSLSIPASDTAALKGYGWVVIGAMGGAWLSVAATRRSVTFEEMPDFLSSPFEPLIRLTFVGLLSVVFALFIQLGVLSIELSAVNLKDFPTKAGIGLLLGLIAGISEKAVSVRILGHARTSLGPSPS